MLPRDIINQRQSIKICSVVVNNGKNLNKTKSIDWQRKKRKSTECSSDRHWIWNVRQGMMCTINVHPLKGVHLQAAGCYEFVSYEMWPMWSACTGNNHLMANEMAPIKTKTQGERVNYKWSTLGDYDDELDDNWRRR